MEPEGSIPNSQNLCTCPYPELDQSSPHHPIPPIILTLSNHPRLDLPSGLLPSDFITNNLYAFLFSFVLHDPPSHPPHFNYSNNTWRRVQIMKLFIMQFSPLSCHLISLRSKYPPQTLFSNTPSLCSSLNVRDKVSHPYRNTGKLRVLYILIFKFFYSNREDRRFWTEW
jgi:hypothetical protein